MVKGCALLAKRRSVLVQIRLYGRNFRRVLEGKRSIQKVDGLGSRIKGLDVLH